MTISDYIAQFLVEKGCQDVFGLTGWGAMSLNDSLARHLKFHCVRNEAVAPMAAAGYYRSTGKLAIVNCTAGPGSSNCIPGLTEAWVDGAAVFVISGQVNSHEMTNERSFGTAGLDILPLVKPITKLSYRLALGEDIHYVLEEFYKATTTGHPGPVWLDVPMEVQNAEYQPGGYKPSFSYPTHIPHGDPSELTFVTNKLLHAKSPLVILGHGVQIAGAQEKILTWLEQEQIPFACTRFAINIAPGHPLNMGLVGMKGKLYSQALLNSADLIIGLGCRYTAQLGGPNGQLFPREKMIIIGPSWDKGPCWTGTFDTFIEYIHKNKDIKLETQTWRTYCRYLKDQYPFQISAPKQRAQTLDGYPLYEKMDMYYFMDRLNEQLTENMIVTSEAGSNYYCAGQMLTFEKCKQELTSVSFAAMGTSLPLALGAAVGHPDKTICCLVGDGGLELNIQELKTISFEKHNIKIFVLENNGYASMVKWQTEYFEGRLIEKPGQNSLNLEQIAKAFDLPYTKLNGPLKLDEQLKNVLEYPGPLFIEVTIDPQGKIQSPLDTISLYRVE